MKPLEYFIVRGSLERWYKGTKHCKIVSSVSLLHTVKVQWDNNTFDIVPIRLCYTKRKEESK